MKLLQPEVVGCSSGCRLNWNAGRACTCRFRCSSGLVVALVVVFMLLEYTQVDFRLYSDYTGFIRLAIAMTVSSTGMGFRPGLGAGGR